jgi:alginate export protein
VKLLYLLGLFLHISLLIAGSAIAAGEGTIPEKVPAAHWSCRELKALAERYGSGGRLPDAASPDATVSRNELVRELVGVLEKVADKCAKEGEGAVPPEDLARLAVLKQALMLELEGSEGYLRLRETIDRLLAPQEAAEPTFVYKYGANGFIRGEGTANFRLPDYAYNPGHGEGRILYRVKPYLYWHPTGYLDIHLEGQGFGYSGGSQYLGKVSLYQGYIEAHLPAFPAVALKGGRQEFTYGSSFILGSDPFVKGRSFDGGRLRLRPTDPLTVDLLAGAYATPFALGVTGNLLGGYATWAFGKERTVEGYILRDTIAAEHHSGEHLLTWGMRAAAEFEPVTLEFEPVYQSGRLFNAGTGGNDRVSSYGGHLDLDVDTTAAGYHNHAYFGFAYGSGNREAATDGSGRREFRTPLNDSSLMGDMKVIGDLSGFTLGTHHASGLQVYTLGWGVDFTKALNFSGTVRHFRANAVEDGFSSTIGTEADFTLTWNVADDLSLLVGYDRFFTGKFFRDATGSGRDIDYGYLMLQFDLARKKLRGTKVDKG